MTIRNLCCLAGFFVLADATLVQTEDSIDEAAAARRVRLLDGKVVRKDDAESGPVIAINLERNDRFTEKYVHLLGAFPAVETISFFQGCLTDTGLKNLKLTSQITTLDLGGCPQVTDEGAKELCRFESLRKLSLRETQITDATILELKKLKHLTELNLYGCRNITDNCAVTLGDMTQLTSLNLSRTNITTASIKELAKLKQLKTLNLLSKQISEASVNELKKQLPLVVVEYSPPPGDLSPQVPGDGIVPKVKRWRLIDLYDTRELLKRLDQKSK